MWILGSKLLLITLWSMMDMVASHSIQDSLKLERFLLALDGLWPQLLILVILVGYASE